MEFVLPSVHPRVEDQLNLASHGLRWVVPDALTTWLGPDGASVGFYQDIERTKREIARYSLKDAQQRYGELVECLTDAMMTIMPYMQGHPWRVRPATIAKMLTNAAKGRNNLAKGVRALLGSIDGVMDEWFEREEVKAPIAAYSAGTFGPITETGTGFHLTFLTGIHAWGVRRPVGGSGAFTQALAAAVRHHKGEIRTNARVARITTRDGVAQGVVLDSGEQIAATDVICAVDPTTLLTKLVDPADLPQRTHDEINALQVGRYNVLYFDVELALSARPRFPGYPDRDDNYLSTLMLCPTMDYMRRSTLDGMRGTFTDEIPMATLCSSVYDRSLVPAGSTGETLKFYAFNTPIELADGRDWEDEKEKYFHNAMDHFELYAPRTRDLVIDAHLTAPPDFEQRYNVYGGITSMPTSRWPNSARHARSRRWPGGKPPSSISGTAAPDHSRWPTSAGGPGGALHRQFCVAANTHAPDKARQSSGASRRRVRLSVTSENHWCRRAVDTYLKTDAAVWGGGADSPPSSRAAVAAVAAAC